MAYRLLGSSTTDSDGQAVYQYTGVGAGEIDIIASLDNPITSGSLQSEPYTILDTLLYFDGTTDTSNWQKHSNTVITYDSEGTHMNGGGWIKLQVGTNNHSFDGTKDLRFEFDIKTPQQVQFRYINNSGSDAAIIYLSSSTGSLSDWNHVKLDYNHSENTITPIINDSVKTSASTSNTATLGLQIYDWNTGGFNNCIVKNFKVYEI